MALGLDPARGPHRRPNPCARTRIWASRRRTSAVWFEPRRGPSRMDLVSVHRQPRRAQPCAQSGARGQVCIPAHCTSQRQGSCGFRRLCCRFYGGRNRPRPARCRLAVGFASTTTHRGVYRNFWPRLGLLVGRYFSPPARRTQRAARRPSGAVFCQPGCAAERQL